MPQISPKNLEVLQSVTNGPIARKHLHGYASLAAGALVSGGFCGWDFTRKPGYGTTDEDMLYITEAGEAYLAKSQS